MRIAWISGFGQIDQERVKEVIEKLRNVDEITFRVFLIHWNSHFYLIGNETEFMVALAMGKKINLIQYQEDNYIHISQIDFTDKIQQDLIDKNGYVLIKDLYDRYGWSQEMYEIKVKDLIVADTKYKRK